MRTTCLALSILGIAASALTAAPASAAAPSSVYSRPFQGLNVDVEPSGLYVSWEVNQSAAELSRADGATGRIEAERSLDGRLIDLLEAGGWLWATTITSSNAITLLRLNPVTLAVTRRLALGVTLDDTETLATAGGWLWAAFSDKLLRLSVPDGVITARIALPKGTDQSMVAADPTGTILLDGEAQGGGGAVQRRDPLTGRLLATSPQLIGVVEPWIGGVIDSGVWISEASGHMGYAERLDLTTLKPEPLTLPARNPEGGDTYMEGNNSISATVADGLVWISQATPSNYCGDPRTGRLLAAIPFPQRYDDEALAIGTQYIYYTVAPWLATQQYLDRIPIPARCLGRS
jgi:hypothetical protein